MEKFFLKRLNRAWMAMTNSVKLAMWANTKPTFIILMSSAHFKDGESEMLCGQVLLMKSDKMTQLGSHDISSILIFFRDLRFIATGHNMR